MKRTHNFFAYVFVEDTFKCIIGKFHHKLKSVIILTGILSTKIVSEYDQEIPQSQTADNPVAPRGRAAQPS